MCAGPAGSPEAQANESHSPRVNSQDDAPLCFRPFEGYYSSMASRRPNSSGSVRNHYWRANAQAASGYV
jgi:hypothetical protein